MAAYAGIFTVEIQHSVGGLVGRLDIDRGYVNIFAHMSIRNMTAYASIFKVENPAQRWVAWWAGVAREQ